MNLLDAQTKATLEHGGAVILDSKYYVMTWETVERMIQAVTEMAYDSGLACNFEKAGALQTEKANRDFIKNDCKCHFCNKESHWGTEYTITIEGGYNSDHDMETVSMEVCAGCLEKMLAAEIGRAHV